MPRKFTEAGRSIMTKRIAPGIWVDGNGETHISLPELLQMVGMPDTPENREKLKPIVAQAIGRANPGGPILYQDTPPEPPKQN